MRDDYADNLELLKYLEKAMEDLRKLYIAQYATNTSTDSTRQSFTKLSSLASSSRDKSPSKVNFTSRYSKERTNRDELVEYFKLPCKDWEGCNPLHWWMGQHGQLPSLFGLAQDLLTIPDKPGSHYLRRM